MTATLAIPHTRIENTVIDEYLPLIGPYGYTIYSVIKRHENQKTGACYPSYKTIARKSKIDRSTVIRYVSKLKALKLISAELRFKEDGSPTSNQYHFHGTHCPVPSAQMQRTDSPIPSLETDKPVQLVQGGRPKPPPPVAGNDSPSRTEPPEPVLVNKKERTIPDGDCIEVSKTADQIPSESHINLMQSPLSPMQSPLSPHKDQTVPNLMPSKKQLTCPHPPTEIIFLPDNITICHYCYSLLPEDTRLEKEQTPPEIVAA